MVLAPATACLPAVEHGTYVPDPQQVQLDLLAALEEGALLQIDWNDMKDVLSTIGDAPPVCAVLTGPDVGAVIKQYGDMLAQHPDPFNAVLVVVSGNQSLRLDHVRAVTDAMVKSASSNASGSDATRTARNRLQSRLKAPPMVLHGVVVDAAISDGLRVTVLAG